MATRAVNVLEQDRDVGVAICSVCEADAYAVVARLDHVGVVSRRGLEHGQQEGRVVDGAPEVLASTDRIAKRRESLMGEVAKARLMLSPFDGLYGEVGIPFKRTD